MAHRLAADAVLLAHGLFIVFAFGGGLLVLRDRRWAVPHLPAAAWACWIEFTAGACPLTALEISLRRSAGQAGYAGGFVDHYLVPLIYPPGLTPALQAALGAAVLLFNAAVYARAWRRPTRRPGTAPTR